MFFTAIGVQVFHLAIVGFGLILVGHAGRYLPAWPAHLIKLLVNAAGVTLFVEVSRLVVQREEAAVALVEARAAADQAALESLRRRLEPHFLFNSLNVLRATIRIDPMRARELVSHLADLYRYLLSHPGDAPLRAEVNHARSYLEIEAARLGDDRLQRRGRARSAAWRIAWCPRCCLQPLVENAVKHGIGKRTGKRHGEHSRPHRGSRPADRGRRRQRGPAALAAPARPAPAALQLLRRRRAPGRRASRSRRCVSASHTCTVDGPSSPSTPRNTA